MFLKKQEIKYNYKNVTHVLDQPHEQYVAFYSTGCEERMCVSSTCCIHTCLVNCFHLILTYCSFLVLMVNRYTIVLTCL